MMVRFSALRGRAAGDGRAATVGLAGRRAAGAGPDRRRLGGAGGAAVAPSRPAGGAGRAATGRRGRRAGAGAGGRTLALLEASPSPPPPAPASTAAMIPPRWTCCRVSSRAQLAHDVPVGGIHGQRPVPQLQRPGGPPGLALALAARSPAPRPCAGPRPSCSRSGSLKNPRSSSRRGLRPASPTKRLQVVQQGGDGRVAFLGLPGQRPGDDLAPADRRSGGSACAGRRTCPRRSA